MDGGLWDEFWRERIIVSELARIGRLLGDVKYDRAGQLMWVCIMFTLFTTMESEILLEYHVLFMLALQC